MVPPPPLRIVSLVPSQTELLFDLGLDAEVVGITKFCIHPAGNVANKPRIGGTKTVHLDRVAALRPTLILANREENTRADVESLQTIAPVHITDVRTLPDAYAMIRDVGELVGRSPEAEALAQQIETAMNHVPGLRHRRGLPTANRSDRPRVAYLIWRNPWMVAGADTFINAMLNQAGFVNAFAHQADRRPERYPVVTAAELAAARPDRIFLSSEPYPFKDKHVAELQTICPQAGIQLVDGELFSWYGSRLLKSAGYLAQL